MFLNVYLLLIQSLFLISRTKADNLIVQLPDGKIQGTTLKSLNDKDYYAFQGIPYAAPPIGANRFKEPKDPVPWSDVLDGADNKKICTQLPAWRISDIPLNTTEDCLYLNVFTPAIPENNHTLLPVLVWIHGGGFKGGSGTFYSTGPKYFMDYGIVVVTINYRLGPIGFLTTMDSVIPGNNGLKDQRHALRWVNKCIKIFGGDPDKVTIAGESAGGYSVGFQLLSLNAKGLFRGSIQESGTSMYRGAYTDIAKSFSYQLGHILDESISEQNSTQDVLNVLQRFTAEDILTAGDKVFDPDYSSQGYNAEKVWGAVLEADDASTDPLVTAPMYDSFLKGDFHRVPILLGYNSEEGIGFGANRDCYFGKAYDEEPELMISRKLNIAKENYKLVGEELKKIFTNTSFENNLADCIKYSTDNFKNSIVRQAEVSSKYVPAYLYQFSYAGKLGAPMGRWIVPGTELVAHAEDLKYLWEFGYSGVIPEEDLLTVKRLLRLWTNFVKYLNPTPYPDELLDSVIWPKVVEGDDIKYLNINNTLEVRSNPRNYQPVKKLFQKYQQPPFVTW